MTQRDGLMIVFGVVGGYAALMIVATIASRLLKVGTRRPHHYVSPACFHGRHSTCRQTCPVCRAPCGCEDCDHTEPATLSANFRAGLDAATAEYDFETCPICGTRHGLMSPCQIERTPRTPS